MSDTVARTCTVVPVPDRDGNRTDTEPPRRESRPLADFRSHDAYVLLGDPGAGKTTAFEDEVEALGAGACPRVSARDFLEINDPPFVPPGNTLFIDGLDEVRAGQRDARSPLDRIRRRLDSLGRPRFRLSCREADWLGENDRRHLARVSPGERVTVLRLDPLTDADIKRVLAHRDDIPDPGRFVTMARDRGVDGLLANPQTLGMLADVVGGGGEWPGSRLETFEQSCLRIVREHNEEHIASLGADEAPDVDRALDAAGRLCAVHLLTGTAGFTVRPGGRDSDLLSPDRCDYEPPDLLRHALGTKLFKSQPGGCLVPVHRHVAEYLAARHLGRLVDDRKLPVGRVIALMAGEDGTVVTEMRGLSAWFAAQCRAARPLLIDRDPIGVVQYGDIGGFADGEKRNVLGALERDLPVQDSELGFAARLRALATPGMETAFEDVFFRPSRDPARQRFVDLLLQPLTAGATLPGLSESLLGVIRDPTWWLSVRRNALDAYCHGSHGGGKARELKELFDDVRRGEVADPDNELLGTLLKHLYPQEMSPDELWDLFSSRPPAPDGWGRYRRFWGRRLVKLSPAAHIGAHLDHLASVPDDGHAHQDYSGFGRPNLGLLARGLAVYGDAIVDGWEIGRLYDWLGVASVRDRYLGNGRKYIKAVREWLEERPRVQKAVILEGLKRCPDGDDLDRRIRDVHRRLHHSDLPRDFGLWCVNRAVAMEERAPRVAQHLLERAFRALDDDRIRHGLTRRCIREAISHSERLKTVLARLERSPSVSEQEAELAELENRYEPRHRAERAKELDYLRSEMAALADNRAPPGLLYQLARVYFGDYTAIASDNGAGAWAIRERYAIDPSIASAILEGFRRVPSREDLPTLTDVVRACRKNRFYHLGPPFLAGLAESERVSGETGATGPVESDASMRLAVAFHFTTIHGRYRPSWYSKLVDKRPELVADMQVRIASAAWKGDQTVDCKLYELAFDPAYGRVAGSSALRLLRSYPTQCKRRFSQELGYLLVAALQHSDGEALRNLIATKLSRSSLGVWQRVRWLAAGWIASPESFGVALCDHADGREDRLAELTGFLYTALHVAELANSLDDESLAFLVGLLGSSVEPERFLESVSDGVHDVTPAMERSSLVSRLIQRLSSSHSSEAGDLLEDLAGDHALSAWRSELRRAREAQRAVRRDHGYRHPGVDEVCRTLRGAEPANVADLAALVEDHLRQLGNELRHGDADGWTQFWTREPDGKPSPEPACGKALQWGLAPRLPQSIEVAREAHHAGDNRSDLRVSYLVPLDRRFHVPVEVKKDEHRDLWTAIEDQLVRKYAIDPAARGHGIYLVLWFGRGKTQRSPDGERPATPEALEDRLRSALSPRRARRISVCVMDVSGGAAGSAARG